MNSPGTQSKPNNTPNRGAVGSIVLACLGGAGAMWASGYAAERQLAFSGLIRVGIFMSAVWLALPGGGRLAAWAGMSPWVMVGLAVGVFLTPRLKYSIPLVIGMLVLGAFIRPRGKKSKKAIHATKNDPAKRPEDAD